MLYRDTYTLTLPFGKFRIRRPSVLSLVAAGHFPAELTSVVWKMQTGETSVNQTMADPNAARDWANLVEKFLPHALVSPTVGKTTEVSTGEDGVLSGTVTLESLPDVEKQIIILCAIWGYPADEEKGAGGSPDLKQFRGEPERGSGGPRSETIRSETF